MDLVKEGASKPEGDADTFKFVRELWRSLLVRVVTCSSNTSHLSERLFALAGEMCGMCEPCRIPLTFSHPAGRSAKFASMMYPMFLLLP